MNEKYKALCLENQLCFPLYAVSNLITRKYRPYLDKLDLTYTQYIVMMVMWEKSPVNEKYLCEALCLRSNTMAPLLKKLRDKGYIEMRKSSGDERNLVITLTEDGKELREKALGIPECMAEELAVTPEEAGTLYKILYKILDGGKDTKR